MLSGTHHVGFTVPDLDRSVAFYSALFETEPFVRRIFDQPYTAEQIGYPGVRLDVALFQIPNSTVLLELIQYLEPVGEMVDIETKNPGTAHLCLSSSDVAADFERFVSLGATPRSEGPVTITSGPNQGKRVGYFRDPDGITIEILEPLPAQQDDDRQQCC